LLNFKIKKTYVLKFSRETFSFANLCSESESEFLNIEYLFKNVLQKENG